MTSASDPQDGSAEQERPVEMPSAEQAADENAAETVDPSVECPNCGRVFTGTYCPDCGQEVGRSVTIRDIAGDAFRELADIEGGFRATLVGLTLDPGQVLQRYLQGARKQFMSPGRYLTVAVLLSLGVTHGLMWLGLQRDFAEGVTPPSEGDAEFNAFMEAVGQVTQSQWYVLSVTILSAGFLALVFWRLFGDELRRGAEALAVGVFLVSHAALLSAGVQLLYVPSVYLWTGHPANPVVYSGFASLIMVVYPGVAAHRCFGTGWKSAVKGVFGAFWAYIESVGVASVLVVWFLVWKLPGFPGELAGDEPYAFLIWIGVLSILYLAPLLIHAGVEVYSRLR